MSHNDWVTCPRDGRRGYFNRKDAKAAARLTDPGASMSAYRCEDLWHVGNLPGGVRQGLTARDDLAPTQEH
jgi:hypothetical protein